MKLERSFTVPRPADTVWSGLDDVGRVFGHLPDAEVAAVGAAWMCSWTVPTGRTVRGRVSEQRRDDDGRRLELLIEGSSRTAVLGFAVTSVHDGSAQVHVEVDADGDEPQGAPDVLAAFCEAVAAGLSAPDASSGRARAARPKPAPPGAARAGKPTAPPPAQQPETPADEPAAPAEKPAPASVTESGSPDPVTQEETDADAAQAEGAAGGALDGAAIAATADEPGGFADPATSPGEWPGTGGGATSDLDGSDDRGVDDAADDRAALTGSAPAATPQGPPTADRGASPVNGWTPAGAATGSWLDAARPLIVKAAGPAAVALVIVLGVATRRRRTR